MIQVTSQRRGFTVLELLIWVVLIIIALVVICFGGYALVYGLTKGLLVTGIAVTLVSITLAFVGVVWIGIRYGDRR
jgi:hypothetical protein